VPRSDGVGSLVEQGRRQTARGSLDIQEVACRHTSHTDDPIDHVPGNHVAGTTDRERPTLVANDGGNVAIQARRGRGIQRQFPLTEAAPILKAGEIHKWQMDRLLQLPDGVLT
jgi:hypothetical protein